VGDVKQIGGTQGGVYEMMSHQGQKGPSVVWEMSNSSGGYREEFVKLCPIRVGGTL